MPQVLSQNCSCFPFILSVCRAPCFATVVKIWLGCVGSKKLRRNQGSRMKMKGKIKQWWNFSSRTVYFQVTNSHMPLSYGTTWDFFLGCMLRNNSWETHKVIIRRKIMQRFIFVEILVNKAGKKRNMFPLINFPIPCL